MALLAVTGVFMETSVVQKLAAAHDLSVSSLKLLTQSTKVEDTALPASAFDTVVSVAGTSGEHTVVYLSKLARCLRPGGKLVVSEPGGSPDSLQKALTLAGLGAASVGPQDSVLSSKPAWETGARASISLKKKPAAVPAAAAWKLSVDDEDDDLIDEQQLLTADDLVRPAPAATGCGPAVSKACKNCTCGRAEATAPVKLTQAMLEKPTSGCGSCALGDAFRCGGCPYRGLPSFELGKKIELPSDFLVTDV